MRKPVLLVLGWLSLGAALLTAGITSAGARVVPHAPPYTAAAIDFMRHLTGPVPLADQACFGQFYADLAPYLPTMSYLYFGPYSKEAANINLANISTSKRPTWSGGTYLPGQGWRGDGVSAFGTTGITPSTDPNIGANNVGVGAYITSTDAQASNFISAATGGGTTLNLRGSSGSVFGVQINAASNVTSSAKSASGYFAGDRVNDSANVLTTKDGVQGSVTSASSGAPTAQMMNYRIGPTGSVYALLTAAEIDIGAGRSAADRMAIETAVVNVLNCLGDLPDPPAPPDPPLPAFFDPGATSSLTPLMVMREHLPPSSDAITHTTYAYGPITDDFVRDVTTQKASTWSGRHWVFLWADRKRGLYGNSQTHYNRPNIVYPNIKDANGTAVGVEITSYAKAHAITLARGIYILGGPSAAWDVPLKNAGICDPGGCTAAQAIPWATANAAPATYFTATSQDGTAKVATDVFIEPSDTFSSPYGVGLDYETADGVPSFGTDSADAFLVAMGDLIRSYGAKAYFRTNAFDGNNIPLSGLTPAVMDDVKAHWDYLSNVVWASNKSGGLGPEYENGVTFLKGTTGILDTSKMIVAVLLAPHISDADACAIYQKQQRDHFAGYDFQANGALEGGANQYTAASTNLTLTELLYGHGSDAATCP